NPTVSTLPLFVLAACGGGVGNYALGADMDAADSDAADSDAVDSDALGFYDMLPLAVAPAPASDIA
ncbi:MAG: hypothetical protein VW981_01855, partial [Rhodobiaceae bacterium]